MINILTYNPLTHTSVHIKLYTLPGTRKGLLNQSFLHSGPDGWMICSVINSPDVLDKDCRIAGPNGTNRSDTRTDGPTSTVSYRTLNWVILYICEVQGAPLIASQTLAQATRTFTGDEWLPRGRYQ